MTFVNPILKFEFIEWNQLVFLNSKKDIKISGDIMRLVGIKNIRSKSTSREGNG